MKKLLTILLFSLLLPNVTNNGAEVSIAEDVTVTVTGDLILNSGNIDISGALNVSGEVLENGGTLSGSGTLNGYPLEEVLGDINGDYLLNVLDIVFIVDLILAPGYPADYYEIADMNEDYVINIYDIILILNIILGN